MAQFDLVFEGGGAKGIVFVGALNALLERGHSYRRLIGTSAGAITATLLAVGYTSEEMLEVISKRTADGKPIFSTFMDKPTAVDFDEAARNASITMKALKNIDIPLIPDIAQDKIDSYLVDKLLENSIYARIFAFVETGGFYSGRTFLKWLQDRLVQKQFAPDITLKQLFDSNGFDLSLVATNVTCREKLVLNHRTAPSVPVANAVRMSMSIPFVWEEVTWQNNWEYIPLTNVGVKVAGTKIVDGGVLSNFPMDLIAEYSSTVIPIMGDQTPAFVNAAENLGLLIDENLQVPDQPASGANKSRLIDDLPTLGRVHNLAETMMSARDNSIIDRYKDQICRLPAAGYGTLEFDMESKRQQDLIKAGHAAMIAHLSSRGF